MHFELLLRAERALERFDFTGLVLLGSLRKDGWPRISPVEPLIAHGHLYLGMMWQSRKALDLLRDARCTVHNTISKKDGSEGEFKVYGIAIEIRDAKERQRYAEALYEKINWKPEEPKYHLFSIDIDSVSFSHGRQIHTVWKATKKGKAD